MWRAVFTHTAGQFRRGDPEGSAAVPRQRQHRPSRAAVAAAAAAAAAAATAAAAAGAVGKGVKRTHEHSLGGTDSAGSGRASLAMKRLCTAASTPGLPGARGGAAAWLGAPAAPPTQGAQEWHALPFPLTQVPRSSPGSSRGSSPGCAPGPSPRCGNDAVHSVGAPPRPWQFRTAACVPVAVRAAAAKAAAKVAAQERQARRNGTNALLAAAARLESASGSVSVSAGRSATENTPLGQPLGQPPAQAAAVAATALRALFDLHAKRWL